MELEGTGLIRGERRQRWQEPAGGVLSSFEPAAYMFIGLSFLLHRHRRLDGVLFMPKMGNDDAEAIDRDQLLLMQKMLNAAAGASRKSRSGRPDTNQQDKEGGTGTRAKGEEGSMGNPNTNQTKQALRRPGSGGQPDPHRAPGRDEGRQEFGMIGLHQRRRGRRPNAPTAPWVATTRSATIRSSERAATCGVTRSVTLFGAGGLGLSGVGEGGGGRGEGIGLGNVGTLGHGAGTGTGQGFGNGHGSAGRARRRRRRFVRAPRPSTAASRRRSSSVSSARTSVVSVSATRTD